MFAAGLFCALCLTCNVNLHESSCKQLKMVLGSKHVAQLQREKYWALDGIWGSLIWTHATDARNRMYKCSPFSCISPAPRSATQRLQSSLSRNLLEHKAIIAVVQHPRNIPIAPSLYWISVCSYTNSRLATVDAFNPSYNSPSLRSKTICM
jgi:hypothetical protein